MKYEITLECLPEDMPVRGNAMASGDDAYDREVEDEIIDGLESGNGWAWCCAHVVVTDPETGISGDAYLGGCCYQSEADFIENSGYYEGMVQDATQELENELARLRSILCGRDASEGRAV